MNRNDFFRTAGRVFLLGGFVFTGIYLAEKHKIATSVNCTGNNFCSSCNRLSGCKLPGAEKYRSYGKR